MNIFNKNVVFGLGAMLAMQTNNCMSSGNFKNDAVQSQYTEKSTDDADQRTVWQQELVSEKVQHKEVDSEFEVYAENALHRFNAGMIRCDEALDFAEEQAGQIYKNKCDATIAQIRLELNIYLDCKDIEYQIENSIVYLNEEEQRIINMYNQKTRHAATLALEASNSTKAYAVKNGCLESKAQELDLLGDLAKIN